MLVVLLGLAAISGQPVSAQTAPNILLVLIDDLGIEHLSAYQVQGQFGQYANMTALDPWFNAWLRFDDAWSNPECSPTRTTIQTGEYSFRTGVGRVVNSDAEWGLDTLNDATLLAKVLKDFPLSTDDYATAALGKWHMGTSPGGPGNVPDQGGDAAPIKAGYDWFDGVLLDKQMQDDPDQAYFRYWRTSGAGPDSQDMQTNPEGSETGGAPEIYLTHTIADAFINWYDNVRPAANPWFAYVAFTAPHTPFHCPPEGTDTPYPDGTFQCNAGGSPGAVTLYQDMTTAMSIEVDRMLRHLNGGQFGQPPNTLIIFASDNGSPGEVAISPIDGSRAKCTVFEGGVTVPLFLGGDMVATGGQFTGPGEIVNLSDLWATIIEVSGASLPGAPKDSVDLTPYFASPAAGVRDFAYTEVFQPNFNPDPAAQEGPSLVYTAIRDPQYKLIIAHNAQQPAFYDLVADRWEELPPLDLGSLTTPQQTALTALQMELQGLWPPGGPLAICPAGRRTGDPCNSAGDCCSGLCQFNPANTQFECANQSITCGGNTVF